MSDQPTSRASDHPTDSATASDQSADTAASEQPTGNGAASEPAGDASGATAPGSGLVRLRWLKILRYRNVRPGTTLRFDDTRNILLGKNGTGKTTLLKLLAAVISSEFRLLDDPYELEYEIEINGLRLVAKAWTEKPVGSLLGGVPGVPFTLAPMQPQEPTQRFRTIFLSGTARATVEVDSKEGTVEFDGQLPQSHTHQWGRLPAFHRALALISSTEQPSKHPVEFTNILWPTINDLGGAARRFDESLDTFRVLVGETSMPDIIPPPYVVGTRKDARAKVVGSLSPGSAGARWRSEVSSHSFSQPEDLSLLSFNELTTHLSTALGVSRTEMKLRFYEKTVNESEEMWVYHLLRFQFTRPSGAIFSHESLSYGQKRLLAFLYYLSVNDHIVIADELVNGLHHDWITLCLDEMGQRQAFLTSQNPLLLDYLPPESVKQAQQRYILCRSEGEELVWENMPEAEAERFFRAYAVGIQHVSEVLLSKGLW